jgi:histone acetyltransferase (RNA polymerase elongator complex component)
MDDYYGAPGTKLEIDIEELDRRGNELMAREYVKPTHEDIIKYKPLIQEILNTNKVLIDQELRILLRKHKFGNKRSFLFQVYLELIKTNKISDMNIELLRKTLQIKSVKSHSGITNITIFTSPYPSYIDENGELVIQRFSCEFNCSYCPNAPDNSIPRSYLLNEPAVLRAAKNNFDCVRQMQDRMNTLYMIGNDIFKLEVNILGGTFSSYPKLYLEEYVRDIYYAANTFWDNTRDRLSLKEEQIINETTKSRVVLIAIETRPDQITPTELKFLRYLSVTRIQIGIQHTDDDILNKINRKCPTFKTIKAIELMKRHGFKIDAHFMPNLPFSSPEKDRKMLIDELVSLNKPIKREKKRSWYNWLLNKPFDYWEYYELSHPELSFDQCKIYETAVTIHTEIEKWYKDGTYIPYNESYLKDILLDFKSLIFPWVRINRIMRDFFEVNIFSKSGSNLNMRNQLVDILNQEGKKCACIRCRENKNKPWDGKYIIVIRHYNASNGDEYFISAESLDKETLYGFVRLRLDDASNKIFEELNGCALTREVHVYSTVSDFHKEGNIQGRGLGKFLMKKAEEIALNKSYKKMAVIASVGSRKFYEKIGYKLNSGSGEYMIKNLDF